jgi:hypothetical protein
MHARTFTTFAVTAVMAAAGAASAEALPAPATAATFTCSFKPATIVGTSGADIIVGTPGDDVIVARRGADQVRSLGGNDTICLGPGDARDIVKGGAGDDLFVSEATEDGPDNFVGNGGVDRVSYLSRTISVDVTIDTNADDGEAGEGDKVLFSVEAVTGSQADDQLIGSDADNVLDGGDGDDDLRGGVGDDLLRGGSDSDTLIGNADDDFLLGNDGNDTAVAAAVVDGADFFEGSVGIDTASYEARATTVLVSLDNVANDGAPGEGDDVRNDVENVQGGSGNDTLASGNVPAQNVLSGNFGSDIIDVDDAFINGDVADGGALSDVCFTDADDIRISCEF